MAAIAPPAGKPCISRPRSATRPQAVLQAQHAGQDGGGVLAHAVAEDGARASTPQLRHSSASANSRATSAGWVQPVWSSSAGRGRARLGEEQVEQRPLEAVVEDGGAAVEGGPEDRLGRVQAPAHAGVLGALPGEQEGHLRAGRVRSTRAGHGAGRRPHRARTAASWSAAAAASGATTASRWRKWLRPGAGRGGHVGQRRRRLLAQAIGVAAGELAQRRLAAGRQRQHVQRVARRRRRRRPAPAGGLLHHDVGVGAAEAERAEPGQRRSTGGAHGWRADGHPDRQLVPRDVGARARAKWRLAGIAPCSSITTSFTSPATPAAASRWPTLVFTEPTTSGSLAGAPGAVDGAEGLHLDRVAEGGAGAVGLDVADVAGVDAGVGQRGADDRLLRRPVRRGEAAAGAVLVDGRAADDGEDAVAVGLRVGEPLQHDDGAALAPHEAVGARRRRTCSGRRAPSSGTSTA